MQLITVLLIMVGLLAALSGAIIFFGSTKANRGRSAWYFLAAIFAAIWTISISNLMSCKSNVDGMAAFHANWTFVSAIMLEATFLGFAAWSVKFGKPTTIIFFIVGLVLSSIILIHPELMYSNIIFTNSGNGPEFVIGPLFFTYAIYLGVIVPTISLILFQQFRHARSKRTRISNLISLVSYAVSSLVVTITDFVMILLGDMSAGWLGPLAVAMVILMIYYTILRYRMINLSLRWLQFFSYIVIVVSIAIVYMIIFSIVFAALFRGSTPSMEVIVLNFIMILIFIALIPAMNGLITFIRRLIIEQHPHAAISSPHSAQRPAAHPAQHSVVHPARPATHAPHRSSVTSKPKTEHKQESKPHAKH